MKKRAYIRPTIVVLYSNLQARLMSNSTSPDIDIDPDDPYDGPWDSKETDFDDDWNDNFDGTSPRRNSWKVFEN